MNESGKRRLPSLAKEVLTAIVDRAYSSDELAWIERIERRRGELKNSEETVEYVDYGAGSPKDQRSAEEMYKGSTARITVGRATRNASKDPRLASLLFRIVREARPELCLEMGAAVGLSAAYQAAALDLNGRGRLVSVEGADALGEVSRSTLATLELSHRAEVVTGRFQDEVPELLASEPFDYVFVDGHHDGEATRYYFDQIVAALSPPTLVVLDDVQWSDGMRKAWQYVRESDHVSAAIDLGEMGVAVIEPAWRRPLRCVVDYT